MTAWEKNPDPALIAFLCNSCQGAIRKGIAKVAHDYDVRLIIGGGGILVSRGGEPEESFTEPLLRKGTRVLGSRLWLVYVAKIHLLRNPYYFRYPAIMLAFIQEAYYRFWNKYSEDLTLAGPNEYIAWKGQYIVDTIRAQLQWQKPEYWHTT